MTRHIQLLHPDPESEGVMRTEKPASGVLKI